MKQIIPLFLLLVLCGACPKEDGESNPQTTALAVSNVLVSDIGNAGNASDLEIRFNKTEIESVVEHYLIVINNKDIKARITLEEALVAPFFETIPKTGSDIVHRLSADTKDFQGEVIKEAIRYDLYVIPVVKENSDGFVSGLSTGVEIILSQQDNSVQTIATGFRASGGIAIDAEDRIYIGDFGDGNTDGDQILRFQPDGSQMEVFAESILGATGGAFDSKGNLFWSGYSENMVHKISTEGEVEDFASVSGPVAIKIDAEDQLFVCACNDNTIKRITPDGGVSTFARSNLFNCANGLAFDAAGNLFVSNFDDGRVMKVDKEGNVSLFADVPGQNSVNLAFHNDHLYVTARAIHRIYRISVSDGSVELYTGSKLGHVDGSLMAAQFVLPNGIAVNQMGTHLLINDVSNSNTISFHPNILRQVKILE